MIEIDVSRNEEKISSLSSRHEFFFLKRGRCGKFHTGTRNSFSSSREWTRSKSLAPTSFLRQVFQPVLLARFRDGGWGGAIWKIGKPRARFQGGREEPSRYRGGGDPRFLEGPWPSNKSRYRKQPLLVPGSTANISTLLSLFHAPSGAGSFRARSLHEIERHCRSTCHLPCVSQSPREASKPDYSKHRPPSSLLCVQHFNVIVKFSLRQLLHLLHFLLHPRKFLYKNNYKSWNYQISFTVFFLSYNFRRNSNSSIRNICIVTENYRPSGKYIIVEKLLSHEINVKKGGKRLAVNDLYLGSCLEHQTAGLSSRKSPPSWQSRCI